MTVNLTRNHPKWNNFNGLLNWMTTTDVSRLLLLLFAKGEMQVGQTLSSVKTEASSRVRKMLTVATKIEVGVMQIGSTNCVIILCFGEQQLSEVLSNSLESWSATYQDSFWTVQGHTGPTWDSNLVHSCHAKRNRHEISLLSDVKWMVGLYYYYSYLVPIKTHPIPFQVKLVLPVFIRCT